MNTSGRQSLDARLDVYCVRLVIQSFTCRSEVNVRKSTETSSQSHFGGVWGGNIECVLAGNQLALVYDG